MFSYGQSTAFGIRGTVALYPSVAVKNPSPSNVYGPQDFSAIVGIYVLKYFKTGRMGVKAGIEHGGVPNNLGIDAPRKAFGTGAGGDAQINSLYSTNDITYNAFTLSAVYKLPAKKRFIEFTIGPSVRHYGYDKDGYEGMIWAYNRSTPFDFDDPAAGPADLVTRVNKLDEFHVSFPVSVDYVIRVNERSQVKLGIMHNIAKPLPGELEVMMYGKIYTGTFRPRMGFWGFNIQYERLSRKSAESYTKLQPRPAVSGKFRKAVFIETYIRPGLLSANYDMRIRKGTNSGLGFTAGAGLGSHFNTEVINNNKSSDRRMLALPVAVNYIIGKKQHGIELGIGLTPQITLDKVRDSSAESNGTFFPFRIGYRFQPIREGLVARAAWATIVEKPRSIYRDNYNLSNVSVSLGYSFK